MWMNSDTESRHFYNSHLLFFSSQKELPEWWAAVNKMRNNWGVGGNLTKQMEANFEAEVSYGCCRAQLWSPRFLLSPFFGGWNESKWQNSKAECHYSVLYLFASCHQLQETVNSDYVFQTSTKLAQQGFSSSFYHLWEELFTEVTVTQHISYQSWMESLPLTLGQQNWAKKHKFWVQCLTMNKVSLILKWPGLECRMFYSRSKPCLLNGYIYFCCSCQLFLLLIHLFNWNGISFSYSSLWA